MSQQPEEYPESWVEKWFMPRASVADLTRALEGTPDGAFFVCDDNVEDNVFHIVYRYVSLVCVWRARFCRLGVFGRVWGRCWSCP